MLCPYALAMGAHGGPLDPVERDRARGQIDRWAGLVREDPGRAIDAVLETIRANLPLSDGFAVAVLDLVPEVDLPVVADTVMDHLPEEVATHVARVLAHQVPDVMRAQLDELHRHDEWTYIPDESDDGERPLVLLPAHHMTFPGRAVEPVPLWGEELPVASPTWRLDTAPAGEGLVGGVVDLRCGQCGRQLHRLLDLSSFRAMGDVVLPQALLTCAACVSSTVEAVYFGHRDAIMPMLEGLRWSPEDDSGRGYEPVPQTPVTFRPTPPRWRFQEWALSNGRQNLNRLGGEGTWVQDASHPPCARCHRPMPFLAQVDTEVEFVDGPGWDSWTEGVIYCYWCADCRVSATTVQQT